jgi:hypothetical protein
VALKKITPPPRPQRQVDLSVKGQFFHQTLSPGFNRYA